MLCLFTHSCCIHTFSCNRTQLGYDTTSQTLQFPTPREELLFTQFAIVHNSLNCLPNMIIKSQFQPNHLSKEQLSTPQWQHKENALKKDFKLISDTRNATLECAIHSQCHDCLCGTAWATTQMLSQMYLSPFFCFLECCWGSRSKNKCVITKPNVQHAREKYSTWSISPSDQKWLRTNNS